MRIVQIVYNATELMGLGDDGNVYHAIYDSGGSYGKAGMRWELFIRSDDVKKRP